MSLQTAGFLRGTGGPSHWPASIAMCCVASPEAATSPACPRFCPLLPFTNSISSCVRHIPYETEYTLARNLTICARHHKSLRTFNSQSIPAFKAAELA